MSKWTESHPWVIEGHTTEDEWARGGTAPARWVRIRFDNGLLQYVRGVLTPKMTLKAAMASAKNWSQFYPRENLRIRHIETGEVIMAAIL